MAYEMAATAVTLNDLDCHIPIAGLFKCNPSNICAAFYQISPDSVLARFLCISRASCVLFLYQSDHFLCEHSTLLFLLKISPPLR